MKLNNIKFARDLKYQERRRGFEKMSWLSFSIIAIFLLHLAIIVYNYGVATSAACIYYQRNTWQFI